MWVGALEYHDGAVCGLVPDAGAAGEAKCVEFGIVEVGGGAADEDTYNFVVGCSVLSGLYGLDVSIGVAVVGRRSKKGMARAKASLPFRAAGTLWRET